MADYKLSISDPKAGKSYNREIKDDHAESLAGYKIGDKVSGDTVGLAGYEFEITGGSDYCGFPMRKDVDSSRKKILAVSGTGIKPGRAGMRQRKTVCGSRITERTAQVNLKILKHGKQKLGELEVPSEERETSAQAKVEKTEDKSEKPEKSKEPKAKSNDKPDAKEVKPADNKKESQEKSKEE